ncbi:hypothetical protein GC170_19065 [bacterium]|nr:hypothetical protein [bacterium]
MKSPAEDEARVLASPEFAELIETLTRDSEPNISTLQKLRSRFGPTAFAAASRIVAARRKATGKLPEAERLWLDPVRTEQATHRVVSAHKALRFAGAKVADLCCGIGGDSFALARFADKVVALDLDPDTILRLKHNLGILGLDHQVRPVLGDAAWPPVPPDWLIHIDPDRRSHERSGRPVRQIDAYTPGTSALVRLMKTYQGGAIKLGPASDFATLEKAAKTAGVRTETEIVSLDGECKEATLWFGHLAGESPRRATSLPAGHSVCGVERPIEFEDDPASKPNRWIFEADPALTRSGLVSQVAKEHGLKSCTTDGAWLAGSVPTDSPWLTPFEVVAEIAADRKIVRAEARKLGWTSAVVKTRGGEGADRFSGWFDRKPGGMTRETMLVAYRQGGKSRAILAVRQDGFGAIDGSIKPDRDVSSG